MEIVSPVRDLSFDERLAHFPELKSIREESVRLLEALAWKLGLPTGFPVIACILGGTGTGKSTLSNSLAGENISTVGMRRPCTINAVVFLHETWESGMLDCPAVVASPEEHAAIVSHRNSDLQYLILIDTPDFDSVELSNRRICEHFFIVSDIALFVTSQEKYADMAGQEMIDRAAEWGKRTVFVMNKVSSEHAYADLGERLKALGYPEPPLKVERFDAAVDLVPGLADRFGFAELIAIGRNGDDIRVRPAEIECLKTQAIAAVDNLLNSLDGELARIAKINGKIERLVQTVCSDMEGRLGVVVSGDIEDQIRRRLAELLRKYDILFVPRMLVKNAIKKVLESVWGVFSPIETDGAISESYLKEDLERARSAARLEPVETAVAKLNLAIAETLAQDPEATDLREVARTQVQRWDIDKIRSLYDESFPGVEHLLEAEFERFRQGLSRSDEIKLYGSYTVWALLLVTAEIIVGGGFTLLDAVLNTVVMPFIPKWMVNLKVIDLLREIGERLDQEHRAVLKGIVEHQAALYMEEFSRLLPARDQIENLRLVNTAVKEITFV